MAVQRLPEVGGAVVEVLVLLLRGVAKRLLHLSLVIHLLLLKMLELLLRLDLS